MVFAKTTQGDKARKVMRENNIKRECILCNSTKDLLIHHKDRNRDNNHLSNLTFLCRSCHSKYHNSEGNKKESRKYGENEWTTMRVHRDTKKEFLKLGIGRETDDEILQRLLKRHQVKIVEKEDSAEYIDKLNRSKKTRKR